ncbi:hypothetical protein PN36_29010 [Candidatus Thiomargarita nelsonii]|uniref:Transposase (putative) YhgA-like domain-containing protein n=1 Tax=Candidatus Thiomargarita nelsonii TaxID=1003181 RepID=A0A0A6PAQ8_9GAMM|nr:hypothetical protein PN36_29010 [Candidatus Thiomargarita nelsonii]
MKNVAPLRYDVIFKKAFGEPEIFTAFIRDLLDIKLEIDVVEKDKAYDPPIGSVKTKFDLYAEDKKNRVIIDMQHVRFSDHYHRFLHYHCAALLAQVVKSKNYCPELKVYTIVILTSGDKHKTDVSTIDFDPKNRKGEPLGEIYHQVIYICPKYIQDDTPKKYRQWLEMIEDSLDEQVDESHYSIPEIQDILNIIEKDQVTPEERARMFEEYNKAEYENNTFKKGELKGKKDGIKEGELKNKKETARNLKKQAVLTEEQIASATGLSVDELRAL